MGRFGRVDEQRRRTGRGEGRSDFARDMSGFADPGDNHALTAAEYHLDSAGECIADMLSQTMERFGL